MPRPRSASGGMSPSTSVARSASRNAASRRRARSKVAIEACGADAPSRARRSFRLSICDDADVGLDRRQLDGSGAVARNSHGGAAVLTTIRASGLPRGQRVDQLDASRRMAKAMAGDVENDRQVQGARVRTLGARRSRFRCWTITVSKSAVRVRVREHLQCFSRTCSLPPPRLPHDLNAALLIPIETPVRLPRVVARLET